MGKNMTMIVPNLVMMPTVSYFFSGFLTARVPFSLTPKFKTMFQRGVEVTSLDVSYVSSLSWYFMLFMGLRGVFSLILGPVFPQRPFLAVFFRLTKFSSVHEGDSNTADEAKMMEMQMSGGMGAGGQPGQPPDIGKMFKGAGENLDLVKHKEIVPEAENRLLQRPPDEVVRKD